MKKTTSREVPKGAYGGECYTPGCRRPGRWIAQGEPQTTDDYLSRYRCQPCCDQVSAQLDALRDLPAEEFYRAARRILDELGPRPATLPDIPEKAARYLAHRLADDRDSAARMKNAAVSAARLDGACEMASRLGFGMTGTAVKMAVLEAYDDCGPRPSGGDARKSWDAEMTARVIETIREAP